MQEVGELCGLEDLHLSRVGVQDIDIVPGVHIDGLHLLGQANPEAPVVPAAEYEEQVALGIVLVDIAVRGCHEHIVMVAHCHRRLLAVIGVRLNQVGARDVQFL